MVLRQLPHCGQTRSPTPSAPAKHRKPRLTLRARQRLKGPSTTMREPGHAWAREYLRVWRRTRLGALALFQKKAVLAFFFIGLKQFIASLARERFEVLH